MTGHTSALSAAQLDATFAALADPTRRAILARLATEGDVSVLELAAPFAMSQPAISKHLKVLERAGLISRGRDAQRRPCRIEAKPMEQASAWIERYRTLWEARYEQLDALLAELGSERRHAAGTAAPARGRRKRPRAAPAGRSKRPRGRRR